MKWSDWLKNWKMDSLRVKAGFLEMEFSPKDTDKNAAWDLYIELLTRITTQPLKFKEGDEKTALDSIYSLFNTTRNVIKKFGRGCIEFTKIAIIVLNQIIRPFTAKWHKLSLQGELDSKEGCKNFRIELSELQEKLKIYTKMLADMADVEDLTELEE
jgi:hypothetical protein